MSDQETEERKPRRGFTLALLIFGLLSCVITIGPFNSSEPKSWVQLSNGRKIQAPLVTYGTNHTLTFPDPLWRQKLRKIAPKWVERRWGPLEFPRKAWTWTPEPVVWLTLTALPSDQAGLVAATNRISEMTLITESGQRLPCKVGIGRSTRFHFIRLLILRSSPRRESHFQLEGNSGGNEFSLRVANPLFGRSWPAWTPTDLPATNRIGEIDFVLRDGSLSCDSGLAEFQPLLEIWHRGQRQTNWFDHQWTLSDATGNRGPWLPTNEPAWRVEFQVRPRTNEVWPTIEVARRRIPDKFGAGDATQLEINRPAGRREAKELWFGGPGTYAFENGGPSSATPTVSPRTPPVDFSIDSKGDWKLKVSSAEPWFVIRYRDDPGHDSEDRMLLSLQDADGLEVSLSSHRFNRAFFQTVQLYRFPKENQLDGMKGPFTLTIKAQQPAPTEFTIDPRGLRRE